MPIENTDVQNDTTVIIVVTIENERSGSRLFTWDGQFPPVGFTPLRPRGQTHRCSRRGYIGHNTLEDGLYAQTSFGRNVQNIFCCTAQQADDLTADFGDIGGRQVDFVQYWDDGKVLFHG
jgi:hypothetical protein